MSGSNDANEGNAAAPAGSGLGNLFALAHLATMTDAERAASSRTNSPAEAAATASDAAKAPSPAKPKAPSSRRPAKKRAVPADLNSSQTSNAPHAAAAPANNKPAAKRPAHARRLTIETSRPTARRAARRGFKMKANQPSFPVVLMAMMSAERNGDSIAFLSDGQSFIVVNPGALERNVLPIHFEENVPSLEEFWHLLAIWGFEVVKDPRYPQVNVYRHPLFRKGDWESCLKMKLPDPSRSAPEEPQEDTRQPPAPASPRREAVAPAADPLEPPRSVTPPLPQLGMGPNEGAMYRRLLELQSKMGQQDPMAGLSLNALALSRRASLDAMQTSSMVNPMTMGQMAMPFAQGVGTVPRRPVAKQGPRRLTNATAPSDAEVRSATQDVVSAAVDALRKNQTSQAPTSAAKKPSPSKRNFARSRRHTVDALPSHGIFLSRAGPTSHLDAMTEQFLARSHARLNSRPAIMGPRRPTFTSAVPPAGLAGALSREALAVSVGAEVELRTKATLLAQQQQRQGRKVSMLGSLGGGLM